ncbi:MAG: hypothetical protein ACRC56_11965 [Bosea sp. (in: a-proteobacteria)]
MTGWAEEFAPQITPEALRDYMLARGWKGEAKPYAGTQIFTWRDAGQELASAAVCLPFEPVLLSDIAMSVERIARQEGRTRLVDCLALVIELGATDIDMTPVTRALEARK